MAALKIDAHYHLWQLANNDYWWLKNMPALNKDFMEDDYLPLMKKVGVSGSIIVQALETDAETLFMLNLAKQHRWISGVIGWVDFTASDSAKRIANFSTESHIVGLRNWPNLRNEDSWVASAALDDGFTALTESGLAYDALVSPQNLDALLERLKKHPKLRCCINHFAYPQPAWPLNGTQELHWKSRLREFAAMGCMIKFSGFGHKTEGVWRPEAYDRFVTFVLSCFSPTQIIWASNWPTVLTECSFDDWHRACQNWTRSMSDSDRAEIFGGTATKFYHLNL